MKRNLFKEEQEDQIYIMAGYSLYKSYGLDINARKLKGYIFTQ